MGLFYIHQNRYTYIERNSVYDPACYAFRVETMLDFADFEQRNRKTCVDIIILLFTASFDRISVES